jgi:hypothetical protein
MSKWKSETALDSLGDYSRGEEVDLEMYDELTFLPFRLKGVITMIERVEKEDGSVAYARYYLNKNRYFVRPLG